MQHDNEHSLRHSATVIGNAIFGVIVVAACATVFVLATDIILILFMGIVFGVFLSRVSQLMAAFSPLKYSWSLAAVTGTLILLFCGFSAIFGVQINTQINKAVEQADEGIQHLNDWSKEYPPLRTVLISTPFLRQLIDDEKQSSDTESDSDSKEADSQTKMMEQSALQSTAKRSAQAVAGIFKTTLGLFVNSLLIFFVGLFLAIDPGSYRDGCVQLFSQKEQERTRDIMNQMGDTLWHWLLGRFASMAITGVSAGLLLGVLGVPMAFTLAVVTALLTFIPNIGPAVALILAILFALPKGGTIVLLVVLGYIALQLVESYAITPLIQQKQASLPPALLIAFQAIMGVLFGFLGAGVASPLLAVSKVGVEEAYIKDFLEKPGKD